MIRSIITAALLLFSAAAGLHAQAVPAGIQTVNLSTFLGFSPVRTKLGTARNASVTAGTTLVLHSFSLIQPAVELRGTYPIGLGGSNNEKDVLAGLRFSTHLARLTPYVDFLAGRGELLFNAPGYYNAVSNVRIQSNTSNVLSPGFGSDVYLNRLFSLKADVQYQHWNTPATPQGNTYSVVGTIGMVYHVHLSGPIGVR